MWETTLINVLLTGLSVWIHFAALRFMSERLEKLIAQRKVNLLVGVFGALVSHTVHIWLYGLAFYWISGHGYLGSLMIEGSASLRDCLYFSVSSYTSLGVGDIVPVGPLRFVAGFEALTGLVLITWTASFLFIEMEKAWGRHGR